MWEQYNQYKSIHKQLAKVKPEKREQFEQRHSRELILYDAAARYLKELKDGGEGITPKAWQREIDQLTAGKQTDTLAMKSMREDLKAVERLRKTAEQLSRQERDKSHDRLKRPDGAGPGGRRTGVAVQPRHADGLPCPLIQPALEKVGQVQVGQQRRACLNPAPEAGHGLRNA